MVKLIVISAAECLFFVVPSCNGVGPKTQHGEEVMCVALLISSRQIKFFVVGVSSPHASGDADIDKRLRWAVGEGY